MAKQTPKTELARLQKTLSNPVEMGEETISLNISRIDDVKVYFVFLFMIAGGYGEVQFKELMRRFDLLSNCAIPVVAGAAKWILTADESEIARHMVGQAVDVEKEDPELDARIKALDAFGEYLGINGYENMYAAAEALGMTEQQVWDKAMEAAGLPPSKMPSFRHCQSKLYEVSLSGRPISLHR